MPGMNEEGRRWYVVNTYSGHENKVKENLEKRVESMGLQDCLFNIVRQLYKSKNCLTKPFFSTYIYTFSPLFLA